MEKLVLFGLVISLLALGCSDDDEELCGNGKIDDGETCDENCPLSCEDGKACTVDYIYGRAENCDVVCLHEPLTGCFDDDGCCPAGCSANDDSDCSSSCGNDEIEDGETCDPPATCPTDCIDGDPCTEDVMTGSPDNCNVVCTNPPITGCHDGDGCCPQNCTSADDDDCGGGQVDCQFDPAVEWHVVGEILQMESADGATCVWLKRMDLCMGICKENPFLLQEVRIGYDGQVHEFDSSNASLSWTPSWHNWTDTGTIDTGTTVYTLDGKEYGWEYDLTASGGESWGPIRLLHLEP